METTTPATNESLADHDAALTSIEKPEQAKGDAIAHDAPKTTKLFTGRIFF